MRSKRFLIGACVLASCVAIPASAFGAAAATQTIEAQVGGKEKPKADKKKFKGTTIYVKTTTADAADPAAMPPKASRAVINFPKSNMKFDPGAAPGCAQSQIANTTTDAAKAACGSSHVGTGKATAALPFGDRRHASGLPGHRSPRSTTVTPTGSCCTRARRRR